MFHSTSNTNFINIGKNIRTCHWMMLLLIFVSLLLATSCNSTQKNDKEEKRPNILLIVADDLGYADLGCYGSDIETPHIDQLAVSGVRFSNFHTSPYCAPTRAMLLSGNDNHIAGMGRQSRKTDEFGYEGHLSDRIVTIPEVLYNAGYHTYIAGKWHLGMDSLSNPQQKGFERSFVNLRGAGNHYDDQGLFEENPKTIYTEDGRISEWKKGAYSTDFFTDKIIQYISSNIDDGKPFFAFAAFTSPHWPLQVDQRFWKKYEGRYDKGYEWLKSERMKSLKKAGMIQDDTVVPPNHERVIPWDKLTKKEQQKEARKMELYAGMVDNLDHNVGRLFQYLEEVGKLDNTLVVFMSDNGAAAEDFYYDDEYGPFIREHFNDDFEHMGSPGTFISYGPQWAEAGSAPFRYFKSQVTEGGLVAPMIISGPGVKRKDEIIHELVTVMDLAPYFYEVAETDVSSYKGKNQKFSLKGMSLTNLLAKETDRLHDENYVFALEHGEKVMLRKGDWKIVNNDPPYDEDNFQLYYLPNDRAELNDLRNIETDKFSELFEEWINYSKEIKVQFPTPKGNNTK